MSSIRPVLLVGTGDLSKLVELLRAQGIGPMTAPDLEHARRLLRNFRVDAVVCGIQERAALTSLVTTGAPVVLVGTEPIAAWDTNCAAFVARELDAAAVVRVVRRVLGGERNILEKGVA